MDIRATLDQLNKLLQQGDFENLLQRCSDLLENPTLAENHRVLLLDQKVKALTGLNRLEEATEATLEELPLLEKILGSEHMHIANLLHNLNMFLGASDKHAEAIPYSERELAIVRKLAPGTSREADALVSMAEHYYEQSLFADADKLLFEALALYEKNDGRRSLGVSTCLNNLGRSSENQNDMEKGAVYLEEAASIREELLGVHPDSAFTLLNYGTCLAALGQYLKAAQTLAHCAAVYEALDMSDSPFAAAARKNLELCSSALEPKEASSCLAAGGCCCRN